MRNKLCLIGTVLVGGVVTAAASNYSTGSATADTYRADDTAVAGAFTARTVADTLTFDQLPSSVQTTIRDNAPNETIHKISLKTVNGINCYKIQFARRSNWKSHPDMVVTSTGGLMSANMKNAINEPAGAENKPLPEKNQ